MSFQVVKNRLRFALTYICQVLYFTCCDENLSFSTTSEFPQSFIDIDDPLLIDTAHLIENGLFFQIMLVIQQHTPSTFSIYLELRVAPCPSRLLNISL